MKNTAQKTQKTLGKPDLKLIYLLVVSGVLSALSILSEKSFSSFLGAFLISVTLFAVFYRDIARYKPKYLKKFEMIALLAALLVGNLALGRVSGYFLQGLGRGLELSSHDAYMFGIPMAAGAMLVTMLFDFHTSLFYTFVLSLLSGLWFRDAAFSVYVYVGGLAAAFSVIRCKRRTAILMGGLYILAANLFMVELVYLFRGQFMTIALPTAMGFAFFTAIASISIVSILLPLLESYFKITTDISLLELLDLDQPLMKNLMLNAPGTYHHSIVVGNMVDAVAEDVGVNPLLARVGSYYHDIGKCKMPEYFIENNPQSANKHDRLTPHMSSMVLVKHVKEGVDLGNEYKLPEPIIEIIEQHHGASLMTYFYEKAKGMENPELLSKDDYRYPGPKPQSKVAALVMMADAVEAASRVLHDPTPARIKSLVDKIVDRIYLDGQLDECELTFKDINIIKGKFTRILTGVLHKRIDYPTFNFDNNDEQARGNGSHGKQQAKEDKIRFDPDKEGYPSAPTPYGN